MVDQDSHEREVAEHGYEPVGEMEAPELCEKCGVVATVAPCVVKMPDEIM
jgi:hypothetical protein